MNETRFLCVAVLGSAADLPWRSVTNEYHRDLAGAGERVIPASKLGTNGQYRFEALPGRRSCPDLGRLAGLRSPAYL